MNIVFGGSFDPITKAHQEIISFIVKRFKPDNFILLIAGNTYYKTYDTSYKDRLNMAKIALNKLDIIYSNLEESNYHGTLYTLETLRKEYHDITFLLGADQFVKLPKWIDYQTLIKDYKFIVLNRDELLNDETITKVVDKYSHNFTFVEYNNDYSSTLWKDKRNKDIIDPKVLEYICEHKLYQSHQDKAS
jgi:nicotinate-nucleotide adenylyltransferase